MYTVFHEIYYSTESVLTASGYSIALKYDNSAFKETCAT